MCIKDFSIIIATKDRKNHLLDAVVSIMNQEQVSLEIIIVDDASCDGTGELVKELRDIKKYPIVYIRNESCCFAHNARKTGLLKATGKYIIFMDDDDFYTDTSFFSRVKKVFESNESVNTVIGSTVKFIDGEYGKIIDLNKDGLVENKEYINQFSKEYPKPSSTLTAVFRSVSLHQAGLFESKMVNDTCIYLYGIMYGDVYLINKPVAAYRIHTNNISQTKFSMDFVKTCLNEKIIIYKKLCDRNRIEDKKDWLYRHLKVSFFYFWKRSGKDWLYKTRLIFWIIKNGNGTQLQFAKHFFHK